MPGKSSPLSPRQEEVLGAVADALIPPSALLPETPTEVGVVARIRDSLPYSHAQVRFFIRAALFVLQYFACFYRLRGRTFLRLDGVSRRRFLFWIRDRRFPPLRLLIRLLEVFILSNYYASETIYRRLGYQVRLPDKTPSRDLYGPGLVTDWPDGTEEEVEICVIGSGAGGAVMAKELAERGHQVVLLEEGGRYDLNDFKQDPIDRLKKIYRDAGIYTTFGLPPILLPLGRAIGGTTIINSGTCFRTPEAVFRVWRDKFGLNAFSTETMTPYFERVEAVINVVPIPEEQIGGSGRVIARGLAKLNLPGEPLKRNVRGCQASGLCCFGCPTDGKQSVQLNYIPQALRAGARLFPNCKVLELKRQGGRITEVIAKSTAAGGKTLRLKPRLTVLAAGTVGTPLLLFQNGLGNASGHLGRHLTVHPTAKALAIFEERLEGWKGVPQSYYSDFLKGEGISFEGVFTPPSVMSTALLLHGEEHKKVMEKFAHMAAFGFLMQEEARGRLRRLPNGDPFITYNLTNRDLKTIVHGLTWLARIYFAAGALAVYPGLHSLPVIRSVSDLDRFYGRKIKRTDLDMAAFHPLGTARMGRDARHSVVDEFGRVHDLENLFISDGSVFPTNLGVNPQVTIMAFATRAAEHIHNFY